MTLVVAVMKRRLRLGPPKERFATISGTRTFPTRAPSGDRPFPVLSLVGGKWTTIRALAEEVADLVLARMARPRLSSTRDLAIGGGRDYPRDAAARDAWIEGEIRNSGLPSARVAALLKRYGTTAEQIAAHCAAEGDPMLAALPDYGHFEIEEIARSELVGRLSDVLFRRTTIAITGRLTAAAIAESAAVVGAALDWNASRMDAEIADTVALARDWHGLKLNSGELKRQLEG